MNRDEILKIIWHWLRPKASKRVFWVFWGLLAATSGMSFTAFVRLSNGFEIELSLDGIAAWLTVLLAVMTVLVFATGLWMLCKEWNDERKLTSRKIVIALETIGLRAGNPKSWKEALEHEHNCQVHATKIDVRERFANGYIERPENVIDFIHGQVDRVRETSQEHDASDVTVAAAGICQVPINILVGALLDDDKPLEFWDYNPAVDGGAWHKIDGRDDGETVEVLGLDSVSDDTSEVTLAISVSFRADLDAIQKQWNAPLVQVAVANPKKGNHWSSAKQMRIANEFHNVACALKNKRVRTINLVAAVPASVAIRLGTRYDIKNHPPLTVWEYTKGDDGMGRYPWGIGMPLHHGGHATVKRGGTAI